jgi:hypothetical protein
MYPYQLSKVLADQRIRDRVAAAERHRLVAAAGHRATDTTGLSPRYQQVTRWVLARFHARGGASVRATTTSAHGGAATVTSASGAGPIGCSA